ncbi:MAG: glycosyltransferase family 39 protein [Planctomycetes bacterium]|nr:glycosyltransferase family 39 protein [Planctomycetota bacterium]
MKPTGDTKPNDSNRETLILFTLLTAILCGGAFVRVVGLGGRSLWADEFCTWHVSRMPLGDSLQWGPELTKPPLYQIALRALTYDAHPEEWLLRLPAALAGVLTILAACALARRTEGVIVGCAAAGLVAFNLLQIAYSQEARPYTFHVLGATVATLFWWRLVTKPSKLFALAYVSAVALTFHSHYLSLLVFGSHALWWLMTARRGGKWRSPIAPLSLIGAGILCVPVVLNYLRLRTSTFQGLDWIKPPTWGVAISVLNDLGFGLVWTIGLGVAIVAWMISLYITSTNATPPSPLAKLSTGRDDVVGLLLLWLGCSWFGLMVLSWIAHPAMVDRYAIPAAIPTLLIPLIVAGRLHKWIPIVLMIVFSAVGLNRWQNERLVFDPGFRELSAYLSETVDPARDLVVLTIDRQTHPDWIDAERLPFDYYPIPGAEIGELHLDPDGATVLNDVLEDPRQIYLVVLWADPFPILKAAGRQTLPFEIDGQEYSRLLFTPYRLIRVAAKD